VQCECRVTSIYEYDLQVTGTSIAFSIILADFQQVQALPIVWNGNTIVSQLFAFVGNHLQLPELSTLR